MPQRNADTDIGDSDALALGVTGEAAFVFAAIRRSAYGYHLETGDEKSLEELLSDVFMDKAREIFGEPGLKGLLETYESLQNRPSGPTPS